MELVALQDFGHLKRGDKVEVPDGEEFSPLYFADASEVDIEVPADATPEATGTGFTEAEEQQLHPEEFGEPVATGPEKADPAAGKEEV